MCVSLYTLSGCAGSTIEIVCVIYVDYYIYIPLYDGVCTYIIAFPLVVVFTFLSSILLPPIVVASLAAGFFVCLPIRNKMSRYVVL